MKKKSLNQQLFLSINDKFIAIKYLQAMYIESIGVYFSSSTSYKNKTE